MRKQNRLKLKNYRSQNYQDGQVGSRISSPQELTHVWQEFLDQKFSPTDLEQARAEFESLPEDNENENELADSGGI